MIAWAIIPVKASADAKTRLAGALNADERTTLVDAMLAHVVNAAASARNIAQVCLLGTRPNADFPGVIHLSDPGGGLNAAAQSALADVARRGADRAVFVHADLPLVSPHELELLAAAPADEVAIAPDRHGSGTNAISLPLPQALDFTFAFGANSFVQHKTEAERLGLRTEEIHGAGLAHDVDEPEDLSSVEGLFDRDY